MMRINHSVIINKSLKDKKKRRITKEFNVPEDKYELLTYKDSCYKGIISEKASFRRKQELICD